MRSFVRGAVALVAPLLGTGSQYPNVQPVVPLVQPPGPCSQVPAQLAPGARVAGNQLAAFDFLNPTIGVGLSAGEVYCLARPGASQPTSRALPVRLVVTTDAGHRWEVEGTAAPPGLRPGAWFGPPVQPLALGNGPDLTAKLAFSSDLVGWVEVGGELSFTSNGGSSWELAHLGAPVAEVAQTAGEALAVTWGRWQLWRSTGASGRWRLVSAIPVAAKTTEADITLGPAPSDAAVATSHYADAPPIIAETSDGGRSWQVVQNPCRPPHWSNVNALGESPGGTMAVFCLGPAAGGSATHGFYVSSDRGRTWDLRAADTNLVNPGRSGLPVQDSAVALAAPTASLFYIGTENTFFVSVDGGRHWQRSLTGNYGYGVDAIDFVGARHGWASLGNGSLGSGLIATDDGLHWGPP